MIEAIAPIWQRVLQRANIGLEDNFFDLGGDSSLALKLFTEIAQVCGRELPPVTIYQAPTMAALAALLEQPTAPRFPGLVLLKDGNGEQPVFIAHGLGGSVIDFYQPVKHIESGHPVYGLQAKGIDGVEEPFDRIEDMAQFYLDEIKQVQPHGPYLLIGYSLGGLVTLEMAQRLLSNGEKIALLAILDAYPHMRYLSRFQRMRLLIRQIKQRLSTFMRLPIRGKTTYILHPLERGLHIFGFISGRTSYQPPAGVSFSPTMQRVRDRAYLALTNYCPRFYNGKIKFIRAGDITNFPANPTAVWQRLADRFEVETIPGDHLGIITTHFDKLGAVLSRYLQQSSADTPYCNR